MFTWSIPHQTTKQNTWTTCSSTPNRKYQQIYRTPQKPQPKTPYEPPPHFQRHGNQSTGLVSPPQGFALKLMSYKVIGLTELRTSGKLESPTNAKMVAPHYIVKPGSRKKTFDCHCCWGGGYIDAIHYTIHNFYIPPKKWWWSEFWTLCHLACDSVQGNTCFMIDIIHLT